jgi:hypothetical protein
MNTHNWYPKLNNLETALEPCCTRVCLLRYASGDITDAERAVEHLRIPILRMSKKEKKDYIANILQRNITDVSPSGRVSWQYINIGATPMVMFPVCQRSFSSIYDISVRSMERIVHDCKLPNFQPDYSHIHVANITAYTKHARKCLQQLGVRHGVQLTDEQVQIALLPDTLQSIAAFSWMAKYFNIFGIRNDDGTIVLSSDTKKYVWRVYKTHCDTCLDTAPSLSNFELLWNALFPNVHLREFVREVGNCKTCALLDEAMFVAPCQFDAEWIHVLKSIHRVAYMSQKTPYYEARRQSQAEPKSLLSLAWDGMDRTKTKFPYRGRLANFNNTLSHHVQGLINHGYRHRHFLQTFDNVATGCNVAIHLF